MAHKEQQRKRRQVSINFNKTILLHVRYKVLFISTKQQQQNNNVKQPITKYILQPNLYITVTLGKLPGDRFTQGDRYI